MDKQNEYNYARTELLAEKMVNNYQKEELFTTLKNNDLGVLIKVVLKSDLHAKDVLRHIISDDILLTESYTKSRVLGFIYESIANDIKVILEY